MHHNADCHVSGYLKLRVLPLIFCLASVLSGVWRNGKKRGQEASGYEDHEEACGQECCKEKAVSTSCC